MLKKNKVLKTGVPKLKDLKEFEQIVSIEIEKFDHLKDVFVNSVPEIGRKLAKAGGYEYGKNSLMATLAIASNLDSALESTNPTVYHKVRDELAEFNGYGETCWQSTDKCGNITRSDFHDLYESPKIEVIIRASRPLKAKQELANRGVK